MTTFRTKKQQEPIDVDTIPDEFWVWLQQLLYKKQYGRLEITIVEGCIDSVRMETTHKPRGSIDIAGKYTIECK